MMEIDSINIHWSNDMRQLEVGELDNVSGGSGWGRVFGIIAGAVAELLGGAEPLGDGTNSGNDNDNDGGGDSGGGS